MKHEPDSDHGVDEHGNEFWHRHRHGGRRFKMRIDGPHEPEGPGFGGHVFTEPADFGPPFRGGFHGGPPPFGPWSRGYGRRGGRAKRGDVRAAALALLAEEPLNGYQIIQQIGERSGGLWRPSPGSVYPALAQLEDEELIAVRPADGGGRRAYELTSAGQAYVAAHPDELRAPWSEMTGDGASAAADMRALVGQVHLAAFQVVSAGTQVQVSQARKVLAQTRRALYRILADDEPADAQEQGGTEPDGG
jgi:DNA-binding PadR family transcriptional regulator